MKFLGTRFEALFSIFVIAAFSGIFWPPNSYWADPTMPLDASDLYSASLSASVLAFVAVAGFVRRDALLPLIRPAWPILAMLGLAFASAFWSDDPLLVVRRSVTLSGTTLFGIYLVTRFETAQLVAILVRISAFAALVSFIVLAVAPAHYALQGGVDYPTAWKGVYTSKNNLGLMCAFGTIVAFYALRGGYGSRWLAAAVIPANLVLLRFSESGTPVVLLLAAGYAGLLFAAFRRRSGLGFLAGFVLAVIGFAALGLIALDWTEVLEALNRSPNLTGRYKIWLETLHFIGQRPLLGYGYGAFWRHDGLEANHFWDVLKWLVPHAHNGWLETGLNLGIVGMAGLTFLFLDGFYRGWRCLGLAQVREAPLYLMLLVAILVENLTENEILRQNGFLWVLFVAVFVNLGRLLRRYRAGTSARAASPRGPVVAPAYPAAGVARQGSR